MRILFCNKYNYPFSGTEVYMFEVMELLRSKGHAVALFSMTDKRGETTPFDHHFMPYIDFKEEGPWIHKLTLAARAVYSAEARRRMGAMIAEFRPDVAHVRNIYHHLTPSILWELKAREIPVVYHLNDFKVLCPSYNLLSHGGVCEACKGARYRHLLKEKCYPGQFARLTLMAEAYVHRWARTYERCVARFLAPSRFVRDKFVEHGWDPSKFEVLPHFQRLKPLPQRTDTNPPLLYFGRLSAEKGLPDLLRAMQGVPDVPLIIAGDGPERIPLHKLARDLKLTSVEFAGQVRGAELDSLIARSRFTVLPSHAYETLGKTILESYALGRTVVATDLGSRRELVRSGATGLLYRTGDVEQLTSAIRFLISRPEQADTMGLAGREMLLEYTPEAHFGALIDLYERLTNDKNQPSGSNHRHQPRITIQRPIPIGVPSTRGSTFVPLAQLSGSFRRDPVKALPMHKAALRIAFIGGRGVLSKYSGIETYYEEVGTNLGALGHQVTAYCRTYFTPAVENFKGIRVVRLPTIRSKHLETVIHTFLATLHILREPCDVVHYHALGPALFSFIPRLVGKKTVVTVQGLDFQRKKWGRIASMVLRLGERAAVKFPNRTMVVSKTLQQYYCDAYGITPSYVPNGGILRSRCAPDKVLAWGLEPDKYILFLGRLSPEKGCHLLIEAYEKLNTDVKLVMAGASSYSDNYVRQLRSHACARIKILDRVSGNDLDELLTNAMVFVLPSDLEGLSLALLDAMGAGLCVLASDIPENREAIENAGFTFRSGDAADLAERLGFLITNPAVRAACGREAKRRIREQYMWPKIAKDVEGVYLEAAGLESVQSSVKKPSCRVPPVQAKIDSHRIRRKTG